MKYNKEQLNNKVKQFNSKINERFNAPDCMISDFKSYNWVNYYEHVSNCFQEIRKHFKKNPKMTIKKLSKILDKYGYYIGDFRDNEYEQIMESDCNPECPCEIFYYDIDMLDGFIPGFSYKYVTSNKIEILSTYIDS